MKIEVCVGTWRMWVRFEEDAKAVNWRRSMRKERGKRVVIILDATPFVTSDQSRGVLTETAEFLSDSRS